MISLLLTTLFVALPDGCCCGCGCC